MLPLLAVLWLGEVRKRRAFALGYLAGLCFFVPNLSWLRHSSRVISGAVDGHVDGLAGGADGLGCGRGHDHLPLAIFRALGTVCQHPCQASAQRVASWFSGRCISGVPSLRGLGRSSLGRLGMDAWLGLHRLWLEWPRRGLASEQAAHSDGGLRRRGRRVLPARVHGQCAVHRDSAHRAARAASKAPPLVF